MVKKNIQDSSIPADWKPAFEPPNAGIARKLRHQLVFSIAFEKVPKDLKTDPDVWVTVLLGIEGNEVVFRKIVGEALPVDWAAGPLRQLCLDTFFKRSFPTKAELDEYSASKDQ